VKMFDAGKSRMIVLPYGEKNYDDMFSRTDRRTDTHIYYINIARQYVDAR